MLKFKEHINEALNSPYRWSWTIRKDHEYEAKAKLPAKPGGASYDRELLVSFEASPRNDEIWTISFEIDGRTSTIGTGDQFRIFATVVNVVEAWWKIHKDLPYGERPRWIYFVAEKDPSSYERGRVALYTRFTKRFAAKGNFALEIKNHEDYTIFELKPRKPPRRK